MRFRLQCSAVKLQFPKDRCLYEYMICCYRLCMYVKERGLKVHVCALKARTWALEMNSKVVVVVFGSSHT